MGKKILKIFIHMVLPLVAAVVVGGMVCCGFRSGGGSARGGNIRPSQRKTQLTWESICQRKKDIKNGAIIGGIVSLVIVVLSFNNTMAKINRE